MRHLCRAAILCTAASLFPLLTRGQDSQSLGDAARQARQQKQAKASQRQSKDAQPSKTPKVITNDEIPQRFKPASRAPGIVEDQGANAPEDTREEWRISAEQWKAQVEGQKNVISSLQSQIDRLSESIHFAGANCGPNCAQRNERQREKQQQVEQMKSQLEDQKKRLEDMQEQARHQGYGSSVYDPD
jgi:small-conductance mechanosensitive channel